MTDKSFGDDPDNSPDSSPDSSPDKKSSAAGILPLLLILALVIAGMGYWIYQRSTHVYTEDAHISADMVLISTKVAGLIEVVSVTEGDLLQASDAILRLDIRETELMLAELRAQLAVTESSILEASAELLMVERQTTGQLQASNSQLEAAAAKLSSAGSDLEFKRSDWERAESMREKNLLSAQDGELARTAFLVAQQTENASRADVAAARAAVVQAQAGQDRLVVLAQAQQRLKYERDRVLQQLKRQQVVLNERQIVAPSAGIVDQTFVHVGEFVIPGQRLAIIHDPATVSVKANIKETELRHLQLGQPVEVTVDAYPDRVFEGEVVRIGNAATSQFALLPSTNPSGNFTKVTQRLPVKIRVQQEGDLLKPGMMAEVSIDIR